MRDDELLELIDPNYGSCPRGYIRMEITREQYAGMWKGLYLTDELWTLLGGEGCAPYTNSERTLERYQVLTVTGKGVLLGGVSYDSRDRECSAHFFMKVRHEILFAAIPGLVREALKSGVAQGKQSARDTLVGKLDEALGLKD